MTSGGPDGEVRILLGFLDRAYDQASWHGTNLRGSIRGLTPGVAAWRPQPGRHCIAEHVLHAAYWKYTVRRRLRGDRRGSFPLRGSDWFPVEASLDERAWREQVRLLEAEHRALRGAVAEVPVGRLHESPAGGRVSVLMLIEGIAAHDLYHAGQIQLLKRMQAGG